ncbi:hypothetical protein [Enterobacter cloacae]|uniref:hypothetical protein n=1 Tax=Enterobacter cloacae TaxID=550 RepID=UPI002FF671C8
MALAECLIPTALQTSAATNQGFPSTMTARILQLDSKEKMEGLVFMVSTPTSKLITTATPITGGELDKVGVPA